MFDINKIRNDFEMFKNNPGIIYFDNSATSFKPKCVIDKVNEYYTSFTSNIHRGDYDISFKVSNDYENVRSIIKEFINADSEKEIVFTSGTTASLNIISYGYILNHLNKGDVILTTLEEHASSILPLFKVCKEKGIMIEYIPLNDDGTFNLDNYSKCLNDFNVKFVNLPIISNVLGYLNPINEIINLAHKKGAIVSLDAAQAVSHIKIDVKDLDADFISFSSHKMCGPNGVGVLYGKYELLKQTSPLFLGGGSNARFEKDGSIILKDTPYKFESGTMNIEGVLGLGEACKYLLNLGLNEIHEYEVNLTKYLYDKLKSLDNVILYNSRVDSSIVSFNIKGIFAQDVASYLNSKSICVRSGNHCAKLLKNVIGSDDTLRASLFFYNTKEEVDKFVEVIKETTIENCVGVIL